MSPDLAKFTQLWLQELKFTGWLLQKLEVCGGRGESSGGPPQLRSSHGDADDAGSKFSRSTSPERRCHLFFFFPPSSSALHTVVIIIPNQLLHRARLCATLQRDAQVNPGGHDEHSNQQANLSENASLQRPEKKKTRRRRDSYRRKCVILWPHMRTAAQAKCHVKTRAASVTQRTAAGQDALRVRQYGLRGEVGHTCHLCEPLW